MDIGILNPKKVEFFRASEDFVGLKHDGKEFRRIALSRALPYQRPESYISVFDEENKEIGIIRELSELPAEQAELLRTELRRRYFSPQVLEILSTKEKMGYLYVEVRLDSGQRTFALKDFSRNIKNIGGSRFVLFDVDGNRYIIEDLNTLDQKSRRRIDPYLY